MDKTESVGYHYFLIDIESNIKIGFTGKNPYRRIMKYFANSTRIYQPSTAAIYDPFQVCYKVLGIRNGTRTWERDFHHRHHKSRVIGEWYPLLSNAYIEAMNESWDDPRQHINIGQLMCNAHMARCKNILLSLGVWEDSILLFIRKNWSSSFDKFSASDLKSIAKELKSGIVKQVA